MHIYLCDLTAAAPYVYAAMGVRDSSSWQLATTCMHTAMNPDHAIADKAKLVSLLSKVYASQAAPPHTQSESQGAVPTMHFRHYRALMWAHRLALALRSSAMRPMVRLIMAASSSQSVLVSPGTAHSSTHSRVSSWARIAASQASCQANMNVI